MQYGDMWRKIRKIIHQYFMEANCEREYWKVQEAEAIQMVHDYLVAPQDHMLHPKRYSNSITNSLGIIFLGRACMSLADYGSIRYPDKNGPRRLYEAPVRIDGEVVFGHGSRLHTFRGLLFSTPAHPSIPTGKMEKPSARGSQHDGRTLF